MLEGASSKGGSSNIGTQLKLETHKTQQKCKHTAPIHILLGLSMAHACRPNVLQVLSLLCKVVEMLLLTPHEIPSTCAELSTQSVHTIVAPYNDIMIH